MFKPMVIEKPWRKYTVITLFVKVFHYISFRGILEYNECLNRCECLSVHEEILVVMAHKLNDTIIYFSWGSSLNSVRAPGAKISIFFSR